MTQGVGVVGAEAGATTAFERAHDAEAEAYRTGADPAGWHEVEVLYRSAVAADPGHAASHHRLGVVQKRQQDWVAAAASLQRAVDLDPDDADHRYQRGLVLDLAGAKDEARDVYRTALERDPVAPPYLGPMLAADTRDFVNRRATAVFVHRQLDQIRALARASRRRILPMLDRPVFWYWPGEPSQAPPVVRACLRQVRTAVPEQHLHVLDDQTWPYYTELTPEASALRTTDPKHFADLLGLSLLGRYGGVWLDPTCYLRADAWATLQELLAVDAVALRYTGPRIATWLFTASPASYLIATTEAALRCYWSERSSKQGYFMVHNLFEVLYWADPRFRELWDAAPRLSASRPHALQHALDQPGDGHQLREYVQAEFVHKLLAAPTAADPGTLLAALIRESPVRTP